MIGNLYKETRGINAPVDVLTIALIILFFLITLILGYYSPRRKDTEGFFIANRKLGVFQSVMTLSATFIGAMTLLVYTAFVFTYGISALWIFIGYFVGFVIFTPFALYLKKFSHGKNFYTLTDYFKYLFGKNISLIVITVIFIWYFGTLSAQFIGGGKVLSEVTSFPFEISAVIMCLVIVLYLILGGLKSVVRTDIFQFIILLILIGGIAYSLPRGIQVPLSSFNPFNAGLANIIAFFLLGIFTPFATQDYWQRIFAMKNIATVKKSFILTGFLLLLIAFLLTYIGLVAKTAYTTIDADLAIIYSFTQLVPSFFLGFVAIAFFTAILSTADTFLFLLAVNSIHDFFNTTHLSSYQKVNCTRLGILIIGFLALGFALVYPNIVNVTIIFKSIGLVIAPIVLLTWLTRGHPTAIITTVITSTLLVIIMAGMGFVQPELVFIGMIGGFLIYGLTIILSTLWKSSAKKPKKNGKKI